ncbi:alpha/beta hydrolase [Intrasporangium sp.]|uniref:alpha/beta fold hydrolase n=1 Tax=Intrasporangium sp. TaxID=1925024 RepID=UPI00293AE6A7|nr:alpha/beta hydrolase [Intrasporangium sp.]MDV3221834.1 alpha/beta hydrolase [Intrasporangium sp.]
MKIPNGSAVLATEIVGDGPDVLLLHAGVADRRAWRPLVERLAATNRCLSFDARGHGRTTYTPEPFSRVDDAIAVLDALDASTAVVIGNSMGGRTALDLALTHPERVAALVLIAPAISGAPEGEDSPEVQAIDEQMQAAEASGDLDELNRLEARFWLDGINGGSEGRVDGATRELFLDMNGRALAAEPPGEENSSTKAWERLEELDLPTLVVVGELDYPVSTDHALAAAERIPGARVVRLPDAAHLPVLEENDACLRAVADFVADHT